MTTISTTVGRNPLEDMEKPLINKGVQKAILGCNLKSDRMISVHFQGKQFNTTTIQVYAPTSNSKEAEVEQLYEDLQDLLELTTQKKKKKKKKKFLFIIGNWDAKVRSQ